MHARSLALAALAAAALSAASAACTVTRDEPVLVGQDIRLTIIHTSDIHSRIFPYTFVPTRFDEDDGLIKDNGPFGGAARMATVIKGIRGSAGLSPIMNTRSGDIFASIVCSTLDEPVPRVAIGCGRIIRSRPFCG